MRVLSTSLLFTMALLCVLAVPTPAKADTLDDLIVRVQAMMEEMAKVQVQLLELKKNNLSGSSASSATSQTSIAPTGSVLGATTFKFAGSIATGDTSADVKKMQQLMKTDSAIYPEGITSGYYGPATIAAVRKLQKRFGLDPVGVVGPATTALLERLISQQNSDGTYPSDILDPTRPTGSVLGASTTKKPSTPVATKPATTVNNSTKGRDLKSIDVVFDGDNAETKVVYRDGDKEEFIVFATSEEQAVAKIAKELGVSSVTVNKFIEIDKDNDDVKSIEIEVEDEDQSRIKVVYKDGTKDTFKVKSDELDDIYEEAAEELDMDEDDIEDMAKVVWELEIDNVRSVTATKGAGETEVEIRLKKGSDITFTVNKTKEKDVVKEIAARTDLDKDDIDDEIDFEERELKSIDVEVEDDEAEVTVRYKDGERERFTIDEDDEDDMIEEIADKLDAKESTVEDVIDFDYND